MKIEKYLSKLDDNNSQVRISSLVELGRKKDPESVSYILKIAGKEENEDVRAQIAICLGEIGSIEAGNVLIEFTKDSEPLVRMEAASSLGIIGAKGFTEAKISLERLIPDNIYTVRKNAIKALGFCGDHDTVTQLLGIFEKEGSSIEIKSIIAQTIRQIGGSHAMKILTTWALKGSMEVRRETINALGMLGDENTVDLLIKIMREKREDKVIRNYAREALKSIVTVARNRYLTIRKKIESYF